MRAYGEITHYEEQLVEHGILLTKFWLHISKDEQLRRFRERKRIPHKQWKITDEDWRNRRRWDDYELAVNEMVARTSTRRAPLGAGRGERQELRSDQGDPHADRPDGPGPQAVTRSAGARRSKIAAKICCNRSGRCPSRSNSSSRSICNADPAAVTVS